MRHIKNFICRRLDMEGLVGDDFGMELLVGGSLMDLGLPIRAVYEQVRRGWRVKGHGVYGVRR